MKIKSLLTGLGAAVAIAALSTTTLPTHAAGETVSITAVSNSSVSGTVNGVCAEAIQVSAFEAYTGKALGSTTLAASEQAIRNYTLSSEGPAGPTAVVATCAATYNGGPGWRVSTAREVVTAIDIEPGTFRQGQVVKVSSNGFRPGETVRLEFLKGSTVLQTWTATANSAGVVTYTVAFPYKGLARGTYDLRMTGQTSQHRAVGGMYWGSPSQPNQPSNPGGSNNNNGRPGLPKAGH